MTIREDDIKILKEDPERTSSRKEVNSLFCIKAPINQTISVRIEKTN